MSCRTYINKLSSNPRVQDQLELYHNQIFKRLIDSRLFNKWHDNHFLPPVGDGRYTKAHSLISDINKEYGVAVTSTAFTKAHQKEFVFVNVSHLLPKAEQAVQSQAVVQGVLFQKNENAVNATLKIIDALNKSPRQTYPSNQIQGFYNDLRRYGANEQQIGLLKDYISQNNIKEINKAELIAGFMADMSYTVEINTAFSDETDHLSYTVGFERDEKGKDTFYIYDWNNNGKKIGPFKTEEEARSQKEYKDQRGIPTQHYSSLTVPGGTNYTENEIRTPDITPAIKGHAQFSTDNGIGWFRSDDKTKLETSLNPLERGTFGRFIKVKELNLEDEDIFIGISRFERGLVSKDRLLEEFGVVENLEQISKETKTRRILEVQSDLFQKGRENQNIVVSKGYEVVRAADDWTVVAVRIGRAGYDMRDIVERGFSNIEDANTAKNRLILNDKNLQEEIQQNQFLQLLNKDNNWVTFFVKSIIQDSAKKGYENVLFPTGDTAAKVEGHSTVEEFIKLKENRLKDLEKQRKETQESTDEYIVGVLRWEWENGDSEGAFNVPNSEKIGEIRKNFLKKDEIEINQIRKEIEDAKQGRLAISSIANFYEKTIKNILDKRGYSPKRIKDEYGNEWYSVKLSPERDLATFYFQKPALQSSKASPKTVERVKEWLSRVGIKLEELDVKRWGGVNGVANLLEANIQIAEGKENIALPEEAMHFAVNMLKQSNPSLYKQMFNKIGQYNVYKLTRDVYKDSPEYQLPGGGLNIPKIKDEAIGKLLAEYYIQKEEMSTEQPELLIQTKTWWEQLVDWIKGLLVKAQFNPFEEALEQAGFGEQVVKEFPNGGQTKEYAELVESLMNNKAFTYNDVRRLNEEGQYSVVVADVASQLSTNFLPTVTQYLDGDEALGREILEYASPFLQIAPSSTNEFADGLEKKLEDKINEFQLRKVVDDKAPDEDDRNYYEANIEGKPKRIGRTTEWAKKKNIQYTKGKDFFENLTQEQKNEYAKKAMSGINGHFDLERIVQSALNSDGTLKPREDVLLNFKPATAPSIFRVLQEFLLGTPSTQGFLYQFEPGSKFRVEQQILNEKVVNLNDKGERVKGRAGTIDLLVMQPSGDVIIYDWKFMGMSETNPVYHTSKQSQHKLQLSDYKRTLKEGYGLKESQIKAFTIPIAATYQDIILRGTKEKIPVLVSVKIGNVNIKTEERTHLLPVIPDDQSTGNKHIDALIASLNAKYKRIFKKRVGEEEWLDKVDELETLSSAIRNLQVAINFEPLSVEALNFKNNIQLVIDKYADYDAAGKTKEELAPVLQELADAINTAKYYADVDKVFVSEYGSEDLTEKNKDVLASLQTTASTAKTAADKIQDIINDIIAQKSEDEGIMDILSPEKEAKGTINSLLESGSAPIKSLNFLTKTAIDARSADQIETQRILEEFGNLYIPLTKLASQKNVSPLSLIANMEEHRLIRRIDKSVFDDIKKAKLAKDKKALVSKLDASKLKSLIEVKIQERNAKIDRDPTKTDSQKKAKKLDVAKSLNIERVDFNGWKDRTFSYLVGQSIKEEENYSKEYQQLLTDEYKPALDMYNFIVALNQRAKDGGYLDRNQGLGFLAFVNATLTQRVLASSDKFDALKSSLIDMVTIQEYEERGYGKKDEETGQIDRSIPTYFTRSVDSKVAGKEEYKKFLETKSKDLLSIVPLYIRALVHFETSKKLESLFEATLLLERNKGHLEKEGGKVIFQGNTPKVFVGNNVNVQKVQEYIDDQIYGINMQDDDLLSRGIGKITSGENKEQKALSLKKGIEASNRLVQQLAVGLKLLVAIPNYIGAHLQAIINAGNYYKGREYERNHTRIIASALQSDVEKALIDLIVPLNDENFKNKMRGIAWKQSPRKWLSTISFQDFMMSTNRIPDLAHEMTNALTWMENTMVVDGQLVNIRQYLRHQPEYAERYRSPSTIKAVESAFEAKVKEMKETKALPKIAKFDDKGFLTIPGFDVQSSNLTQYRTRVVEYGRNITSQLSRENMAEYRRNIIAKSFMMFKNWIVKQVQLRALDIKKNPTLDEWEYGRMRLFAKVALTLGFRNIHKMKDIIKATPEGIRIMREIYNDKVEEYYRKTGQKLGITEEEFFDLVRKELRSEAKELAMILSIVGAGFAIAAAAPPDDEEDAYVKNRWKLFARAMNKASDELLFYYNPLSTESITRGTILPALGILSKASNLLRQATREITGDEEERDKAHPLKALFNLIPVASQFQNELLPIIDPEAAKELGIRVTEEARAFR